MDDGLPSALEQFRALSADQRRQLLKRHGERVLLAALAGQGSLRADQRPPPGDWAIWALLAGRGFGKTRAGAEWIHGLAGAAPRRFALVGSTLDNARAVMMEGESGLLAQVPPGQDLTWRPSLRRIDWANGSEARIFSGGDPDALRGGQFHYGWGDEFAHWPEAEAALTNLRMATRLGDLPRLLLTTTPLPLAWLKALMAEAGVAVTRGVTMANAANLPDSYLATMQRRYGGTVTGRQELLGEIVEDRPGALWTRALLDRQRVEGRPQALRVLVGVDPLAGRGTCGIVVVALGADGHGFVLEDASVTAQRPENWARAVVAACDRWQADKVVAETNQGGDMVAAVLKAVDAALPLHLVRASRGKVVRAEPVASLYGEGRVFHCGVFAALEDQLCGMLDSGIYAGPGGSPDRADALVWALTGLMLDGRRVPPRVRFL